MPRLFLGCLLLFVSALPAWSEIYTCPDGKGGVIFKDEPCSGSQAPKPPPAAGQPVNAPGVSAPSRAPTERRNQEEFATSIPALNTLYGKWKDALQLAESTARIALAGPVGNLQAIKQQTEALPVPDCFIAPKQKMTKGMGKMIEGFFQFMQDATIGKYLAVRSFDEGRKLLAEYERQAKACTP